MNVSQVGIDLIKQYETLRLKAYMPTPNDVPTIGYGHTHGVKMGDICTEDQADEWLRQDCAFAESCIDDNVTVPLQQNEFDALVSFIFNVGCGAFKVSTMLKMINDGDLDSASQQFARWNKQKGQVLAGLTRRRADEKELFA